MTENLRFEFTKDPMVIDQILDLQSQNLRQNISIAEAKQEGFVYVQHKKETLQAICDLEPAVVARDQNILAGYAICMNRQFGDQVPELVEFFKMLHNKVYVGIEPPSFLVCGQVCVHKNYRGMNIMSSMYNKMKELHHKYDYCVTEISAANTRSMYAHNKLGFQTIYSFYDKYGEPWNIVLWDWNNLKSK